MVRLRREIDGVRPNRAVPVPAYAGDEQASRAILPSFDDLVRALPLGRVLLAGVPQVALALELARRGHWVTQSDLDDEQIAQLHNNLTPQEAGKITLVNREYGQAAFAASSFDAAILFDAMHTYFEPQAVIGKIAREIKPDGILLLRTMVQGSAQPSAPVRKNLQFLAEKATRPLARQLTQAAHNKVAALWTTAHAREAIDRGAHLQNPRFAPQMATVLQQVAAFLQVETTLIGHSLRLQLADLLTGARPNLRPVLLVALEKLPELATPSDGQRSEARVVGLVARRTLLGIAKLGNL